MAISFMADNGATITCSQDAALYDLLGSGQNYVIGNIGNELALSYNSASLTVTLGTGEAVIRGRHITVTGSDTTLALSANSSGMIVLRYDLSQSGSNIVKLLSTATLETDNINDSGVACDLLIGTYATDGAGVSSFTDGRTIYTSVPMVSTASILYGTTAPTADLGKNGDIYIQYEE